MGEPGAGGAANPACLGLAEQEAAMALTRGDVCSILQLQKAPGGDQPPTLAPAASDFIFPNLKQRQKIACLLRSPKDFTDAPALGALWFSITTAPVGRTGRDGC